MFNCLCPLALCVVASAVAAGGTDMSYCTYDDYMSWSVANGNRHMITNHHDNFITVTVCDYSLGSLEFTGSLDNTMCNYWSTNHNGWNLTTSGKNGCVRTVTKDFDADEYYIHCATAASKTESGYQLNTAVKELTDVMYSGTNIDGTISTAVLNGVFHDMLVYEAWLIMRTYNEDGELDATFRAGTTITIEENITTTGGTPGEDCDCVTDMYIYDWSGNLLGSYLDMESLSIFATKSLVVTPLENKFSAYLDPSIFPDPNGEVVLLEATCQINWGSAAGYADVAVGLPEPDPSTMVTPGGALWLFLVLVGAV